MTLPPGLDTEVLGTLDVLERATVLAAAAHAGQVDKSGTAYILHPVRASQWFAVGDYQARAATVLHDVIEDTAVTYDDVMALFDPPIATAVRAVSRVKGQSDLEYLMQIIKGGKLAVRVKIADSQDNLKAWRLDAIEDKALRDRLEAKYTTFLAVLEPVLEGLS